MTAYQSLGPTYASGEITGNLSGDINMTPMYSFCVDASTDLYQGTQYSGSLNSINGNTGLLQAAYLMNKYVPNNSALSDTNTGVALQWAMWRLIGQGSYITSNNLDTTYASVYTQSTNYVTEAQAQQLGNLNQLAGEYEVLQLNGSQDLIFVPTPTPIPAAVWMFGSGLMGLFGLRRKEKNNG